MAAATTTTALARPADGGQVRRTAVSCTACSLRDICLPGALDSAQREVFDRSMRRRKPLGRDQSLYVAGRPAHSVYAVRSGSLKACAVDSRGEEYVLGFFLPGDVLGLESLAGARFDHFVLALEPTLYCEIPGATLEHLMCQVTPLRRQFMSIVNERMGQARQQSFIKSRHDACARLATLLLDLVERRARRGLLSHDLHLSMDRRDIAKYLGLTVETVSRSFTQLHREGVLDVHGKQIVLLDTAALERSCGITPTLDAAPARRLS